MFSKIALFAAACMAVFVAALPSPGGSGINNSCNGGQVYCCNSFQSADSDASQKAIDILNVADSAAGAVGFTCTPISTLAIEGQSCGTQSACCSDNRFNGAVVFGCDPTNINV